MSTLFVAWQQPDNGEWIPVAKLDRRDGVYRFSYTQGVARAKDFQPFSGMRQLNVTYESPSLFPLFANRLISKSRPEFKDYLRWLGMSDMADDPMAILALTGGIRGTDSIELFQPPVVSSDGHYQVDFFARSLSHLPKPAVEHIGTMHKGDRLFLMRDGQNDFDPLALALRTATPSYFLGYCPKYYVRDLGVLLANPECNLQVHVKCVNLDAPLNMRLFCSASATVPAIFSPLGRESDFQPITGDAPTKWEELSAGLTAAFQTH
ncbi:DNA-binding protein [Duganella sp. FT134W]|uniref:DNA-binding protein n=1 Tax=Duganella margarita TaxID=2692170 RepID=A0A7X4GYR3_9BURK|nr:HIRAN domain-containing protein [Duganella margarita]MYM72147.1 DNA-binding protein [Duganella margarita]